MAKAQTVGGSQPVGNGDVTINVTSLPYSAKCDGTTNDNTAINAALAAAASTAGYGVHIVGPEGANGCVINALNFSVFNKATGGTRGSGVQ